MTTIGENIDKWKKEYKNSDYKHQYWMRAEAALEAFTAELKRDFLKTQPDIPNPYEGDLKK